MAYTSGYGFENFYEGNPSSLDPEYGNFVGVRMGAARVGAPGSPQTANQLSEAVGRLKEGVKAFEVTMLGVQDADQAIPAQHMKEMRALMKLSGVKPSVHGPLIDAAGFGDKGWTGESGRADNERRMFNAIERAKAVDQSGNMPIVFHAANGAPGSEFTPGDTEKGEDRFKVQKGFAINRETGQMMPLEREFKYRPEHPEALGWDKEGNEIKGIEFTPERQLGSANLTEWDNKLTDLATFSKHAEEVIGIAPAVLGEHKDLSVLESKKGIVFYDSKSKEFVNLNEDQRSQYNQLKEADLFLDNVELNFNGAFHKAYKYGTDEQKKKLINFSKGYTEKMNSLGRSVVIDGKVVKVPTVGMTLEKKNILRDSINELQKITAGAPPKIFEEVGDFAKDKAAETFGNLAVRSYNKWKENAPVIAIENLYQGMAFSKADDLKELVDKSRKNFVEHLVNEKKVDRKKAEKLAEKKIGVTWDVGHLNLIKKKGFTDKDVVAETAKMVGDNDKGKYVKHIHLTDNFGFSDSHLAPGMGNVPFKKILEELEKTGRLDEMNKIVEAGGFVQHFKKSPHPWTMGAFGSPLYSMKAGPSWNQAMDVQGSYFGGYGTLNPQTHHSYFGAGFTMMPVELGGQIAGGQSRFDGRPMA